MLGPRPQLFGMRLQRRHGELAAAKSEGAGRAMGHDVEAGKRPIAAQRLGNLLDAVALRVQQEHLGRDRKTGEQRRLPSHA